MAAKRILLLEDDEDFAGALESVLVLEGHHVTSTPSGLTGALLAAREPWDLVLLDLQLEDLSGRAVQSVVGDLGIGPVVVMSAKVESWQEQAFRAGAAATIAKPFDVANLVRLVRELLGTRRQPAVVDLDVCRLEADDLRRVAQMTPAERNRLPFGIIRVNAEGRVTAFNAYEADASSFAPQSVLGQRFFDVAPCTAVRDFVGALEEGFRTRHLDRYFRFVFPFRRACSVVTVRAYHDDDFDQIWIFVSRRRSELPAVRLPATG